MVIQFADISHHNAYDPKLPIGSRDTSDLRAYKAAGHERIAIKISEDIDFADEAAKDRWNLARQLGLKRIGYHFLRNHVSGAAQADYFNNLIHQYGGLVETDTLCLDTEDTKTPDLALTATLNFLERMVATGHKTGIVYSGKWYLDPHTITASHFPTGWRQLWLSDYAGNLDLPNGWSLSQVVARQFTNNATVPGLGKEIDYSQVLKEWIDMGLTTDDLKQIETTVDNLLKSRLLSHVTTVEQDPKLNPHNLADILERFGQWLSLNKGNKIFDSNSVTDDFSVATQLKSVNTELANIKNFVSSIMSPVPGITLDQLRQLIKEEVIEAVKEIAANAPQPESK